MSPQADYLDGPDLIQDLINEAVLNADAPGTGAGQVPDQFFKGGRVLAGIFLKEIQEFFGLGTETGTDEFLCVFLGLRSEDNSPLTT